MRVFGVYALGMLIGTLAINIAIFWVAGSLIASGVKTFTKSCDGPKTKIEYVVSADWFCPAK